MPEEVEPPDSHTVPMAVWIGRIPLEMKVAFHEEMILSCLCITYSRQFLKTRSFFSPVIHSYHFLLYFHLVSLQGLYTDFIKIIVRKVSLLKNKMSVIPKPSLSGDSYLKPFVLWGRICLYEIINELKSVGERSGTEKSKIKKIREVKYNLRAY